jgi:hypothetical protein
MIRTCALTTLTAAGTSTDYDVIAGELLGAYVAYDSAGTMVLSSVGDVNATFLTLTSGGTQWYYPRAGECSTSGVALSFGTATLPVPAPIPFVGRLRLVTNADGTAAVTAIVRT